MFLAASSEPVIFFLAAEDSPAAAAGFLAVRGSMFAADGPLLHMTGWRTAVTCLTFCLPCFVAGGCLAAGLVLGFILDVAGTVKAVPDA